MSKWSFTLTVEDNRPDEDSDQSHGCWFCCHGELLSAKRCSTHRVLNTLRALKHDMCCLCKVVEETCERLRLRFEFVLIMVSFIHLVVTINTSHCLWGLHVMLRQEEGIPENQCQCKHVTVTDHTRSKYFSFIPFSRNLKQIKLTLQRSRSVHFNIATQCQIT